jgi:hypothetical protein
MQGQFVWLVFSIKNFIFVRNKNKMSLIIQLPSTIEQNLKENASKQGVTLEDYILQLLVSKGSSKKSKKRNKAWTEDELLMNIQLKIHPKDLESYHRLTERFNSNTLTEAEHERLLQLHDIIEMAHAERMKYVIALAQLRRQTIEQTMQDLGIKPLIL